MTGTNIDPRAYAVSLILIGIALSRNGDRQRVVEQLVPELLEGNGPMMALRAIQERDGETLAKFLAQMGVHMQDGELAVDALMRSHLNEARERVAAQYERINKACKAEEQRFVERQAGASK